MADPQKINVVVSGATTTQVVSPGSSTINLNQSSSTVNVAQSTTSSSVTSTPQPNINVGFLGVQGIPGQSTTAPFDSVNGEILFNHQGYVSGAKTFFYYPEANKIQASGSNLLLSDDSSLVLSGSVSNENAFLLRESNGKNLIKVDTKNGGITLAENVGANEYKVGIGNPNPQERVHISNGNLRVDGNMMISGHILPLQSGVYDLGSPSFPFKDLYLQGNSIVFVDKDAKITATNTGFSFQVTGAGGSYESLIDINTESIGVFKGDGSGLTGVPYSGLQDAGVFIQQTVPSGSGQVIVDYGKELNYDPVVICSITYPSPDAHELAVSNNWHNDAYFAWATGVTRTGCMAVFSENISGHGFMLNSHISPINPVF